MDQGAKFYFRSISTISVHARRLRYYLSDVGPLGSYLSFLSFFRQSRLERIETTAFPVFTIIKNHARCVRDTRASSSKICFGLVYAARYTLRDQQGKTLDQPFGVDNDRARSTASQFYMPRCHVSCPKSDSSHSSSTPDIENKKFLLNELA